MECILFKGKYNLDFEYKELKFKMSNNSLNYDYEIIGEYDEKIMNIMIICCLINCDKRYKLQFNNYVIEPYIIDDNIGVLDMTTLSVVKSCKYHEKIVSFCLYGNNPTYTIGAIKNLKDYSKKYPDTKCYFYTRTDVSPEIVSELKELGGIIIPVVPVWGWYMMFCRFLLLESKDCIIKMSRDTDCRLGERETIAIKEWLDSNKEFHIMRDHPWHNTYILGGMWGCNNKAIENFRFLLLEWVMYYLKLNQNKEKGPDQYFLTNVIYPCIKDNVFVHDEYFKYGNEKRNKIVHERKEKEYIGEAFDENDIIDQELRDIIP
jgi:protein O-GlcNAc transferase